MAQPILQQNAGPKKRRMQAYNDRKVSKRLETATFGIDPTHIDIERLVEKVTDQVVMGIATDAIEELAIRAALSAGHRNYGYIWIAARLEISKMHKSLHSSFSQATQGFRDDSGKALLADAFIDVVEEHNVILDDAIVHLRDYDHTYDMIRNIQDQCLARNGVAIVERIQHMFMRTAIAIHLHDIPRVLSTYELLSSRLTSSYTVGFSNTSVQEMYNTIAKCVFAVRDGGRVVISAQNVPCTGRNATCHHAESNIGLWPMMRLLEGAIAFAKRPGDKRTDLANICVEPWHVDIRSLLEFVNIHRNELSDQKTLTVTISVPDIFMVRLEEDGLWSLFCPGDVSDLLYLQGDLFDDAYVAYEQAATPRVQMRARELWNSIIRTQIYTGGPSIVYKDNFNRKSNIPDLGRAYSEVVPHRAAAAMDTAGFDCHLLAQNHVSISLPLMVTPAATFNFKKLRHVTKEAVYNLNKLLDACMAHPDQVGNPNKDHRALAIGVHGLADVFVALRLPYNSPEAGELNIRIAEAMYYAALEASCDLAEKDGPYPAFAQSPLAKGIMQYDMWNARPSNIVDWERLRSRIRAVGVRNAALIAHGSGSCPESYTGYTDSTDPPASNVLDDQVICPWLARELSALGIWTDDIRDRIRNAKGSIQSIESIPNGVKDIYRTAWEIDPETIIRMTLQRAPFVCQTQGLSLHIEAPTGDQVGELLMRAWSSGLKTGLHELHARYPDRSSKASSYEDDTDDREMSFDDVVLSGSC